LRSDIAHPIEVQTELSEIPFVYRYNLPPAALRIFQSVYHATLQRNGTRRHDAVARQRAIEAVKERFVRDDRGIWRRKETER
jgi:hypothetical protein